jgi:hypothetical protein
MPISTINSNSIKDGTVIAADILDGTISSSKLVASNIAGDRIAANTLSNTVFQTGSVESYMRAQGTSSVFAGMRNRIINGAMVIDQRQLGASVTPADNQYSLDRWHTQVAQSSKLTIQKMDSANSSATGYESGSAPAGFNNSLKVTSLSSYSVVTGDYFAVDQCIEAYNLIDLNWGTANAKSVTLSFWVKSSLTGTFGGAIANGAFNRSYPFTYTIIAANTWEQKFITIPGDTSGTYGTTNGRGAYVQFALGTGTTYSGTPGAWTATAYTSATGATSVVGTNAATWYITGVQFEAGSTATPFEYRHYGIELDLCQRYFEISNTNSNTPFQVGSAISSTAFYISYPFRIVKRTESPSITLGSYTNWNVYSNGGYRTVTSTNVDVYNARFFNFALNGSGWTSGDSGVSRYTSSDFAIQISAEL